MNLTEEDIMNLVAMVRSIAKDYPQHQYYYDELERKLKELRNKEGCPNG